MYTRTRYYDQPIPENITFDQKLQEFSHKISYISGLQTAGKISAKLAYLQVQELWQQLEKAKKQFDNSQKAQI